MSQAKEKKSFYLPSWIVAWLDEEGERVGGPGLVTGASLLAFREASPEQRLDMIRRFQECELRKAYDLESPSPPDPTLEKLKKRTRNAAEGARGKKPKTNRSAS